MLATPLTIPLASYSRLVNKVFVVVFVVVTLGVFSHLRGNRGNAGAHKTDGLLADTTYAL